MVLEDFIQRFNEGLKFILEFDKQTLREQGHFDTGRLEKSLEYEVSLNGNTVKAVFYAEDYGIDLDEGVPASEILSYEFYKNNERFRGWVKRVLGKTEDEVNSTIYFIWNKWKMEGKPTNNSSRFSSTGETKNWIKIGTENWERRELQIFDIGMVLEQLYEQSLDILIAA